MLNIKGYKKYIEKLLLGKNLNILFRVRFSLVNAINAYFRLKIRVVWEEFLTLNSY